MILNHLRTFSETGLVTNNKKKLYLKLENRGIFCLFLGYAADHSEDIHRILNMETKRIVIN